jgi:SAM-dependent methyltransferase
MKRAVSIVTGLSIWLFLVVVTLSFEPRRASSAGPSGDPSVTPTPETGTARKVSAPYTGDLAIFEDPNRAENLKIEDVMDILKITPGKSVADIGAGSGWFTVRAARRVGSDGKVYAVEINADYLDHIRRRASSEKLANIVPVLGKPDDPLLPANSIDAVLVLKTYHEISDPVALMKRLRTAMRPGGLVGVIDRNGAGDDHGLNSQTVIREMGQAGFDRLGTYDFVKADGMDYFLVFKLSEFKQMIKRKGQ